MVLAVWVQTATFFQTNTFAVTEDIASIALAALHTGSWREVAEDGEEVRACGRARGSAV